MAAAKKNYREIADDELQKELDGLVKALFTLRVRKVTDVVENPAAFRDHRRRIAQIKAIQQERAATRTSGAASAKASAGRPKAAPAPAASAEPKK